MERCRPCIIMAQGVRAIATEAGRWPFDAAYFFASYSTTDCRGISSRNYRAGGAFQSGRMHRVSMDGVTEASAGTASLQSRV
jgi:hypothetical protein